VFPRVWRRYGGRVADTTGTAAITAASIRAARGLNSVNLDSQFAVIPTTPAPDVTVVAGVVRADLERAGGTIHPNIGTGANRADSRVDQDEQLRNCLYNGCTARSGA